MSSSASFFAVFALLTISVGFCQAASCFPKFKNAAEIERVSTTCAKRLTIQGSNMTFLNPKELEKNHWDDHCLANCTLVELKVIVNNEFKKDALLAILKASAPSEALAKLTKIVDECEATSFKHEHGHENKDKKAVPQKDDKKEKSVKTDKNMGKMEKAPQAGGPRFGKPADNMDNKNKTRMMNGTNSAHHHHSHGQMICKQAAKFSACYEQKEREVC